MMITNGKTLRLKYLQFLNPKATTWLKVFKYNQVWTGREQLTKFWGVSAKVCKLSQVFYILYFEASTDVEGLDAIASRNYKIVLF